MAPADDVFAEIIRLQLRKPKSWNWELSTSKSSPHIALPTIQLLNARGKLLLEARDDGCNQRRTWHSSQNVLAPFQPVRKLQPQDRHLQRCKSDNLDKRIHNQVKTINSSPRPELQKPPSHLSVDDHVTRLQRCQSASPADSAKPTAKNWHGSLNRQQAPYWGVRQAPGENVRSSNTGQLPREPGDRKLRKSRSEFLRIPGNGFNGLQQVHSFVDVPCKEKHYKKHKRSQSDDLVKRKLKFNSEESLKRAELDGYKNFITPTIGRSKSNTPIARIEEDDKEKKKKKSNRQLLTAETVQVTNSQPQTIEVSRFNHKIYYIREGRAGALVVCESFNKNHRRRSRNSDISEWKPRINGKILEKTDTVRHVKQVDSIVDTSRRKSLEDMKELKKIQRPTTLDLGSLRSSKSDIATFPIQHQNNHPKLDNNSNYLIHEPLTTPLTDRKDSIIEDMFEKANRRSRDSDDTDRRCLIQQLSTTSEDISSRRASVDASRGYLVQQLSTTSEDRTNGLAVIEDMLEDVESKLEMIRRREADCKNDEDEDRKQKKRESKKSASGRSSASESEVGSRSEQHVQAYARPAYVGGAGAVGPAHLPMGANVSRHSAKGLSGRRSRSSGSICNGRGRCNSNAASEGGEAKVCSSLPSYLDDAVCDNNNHQVERIPPIGGADGCSAPLHWKFSDGGQSAADQGYGSERSPEEEYPPPVPAPDNDGLGHDGRDRHLEPHACYPFITPESTFVVRVSKGPRGLGLSVCGGADGGGSWPGLVRVKRLFPGQPAASTGRLRVGDVLLHANGVPLTGLTSYEALEVLRTAPANVTLRVCRPPPDVLNCVSPVSEVPPPPPRREPPSTLNLHQDNCFGTPQDDYYHGEFEITLTKIQGSLGFTLRKEDDSALGHYVRALVREPALTDGRIKAGDKIIAVNDVEISSMSHEAAVQFLRGAGERVRLRLFRDAAQTPVATLSPTDTTPRSSFNKKTHLRQEAVDMLNDIAVRKLNNVSGHEPVAYRRSLSPNSSPRRSQRHQLEDPALKYALPEEQFHEALLHRCHHQFDDDAFNSLFSVESEDDRPSRPSSLDLYNPNQTPVAARKPRFNFSLAHNAYELNNLDAEVLDAPNLTYNMDEAKGAEVESAEGYPEEPASMPHITLDHSLNFSYKNPAYQSAHAVIETDEKPCKNGLRPEDTNMRKWKGVVIQPQDERRIEKPHAVPLKDEYEILAIELNRGWNSRLGFSLQGAAGVTYVSAVHADSVAARDGRIKPGDVVIKVNDESVEHMSTNEIIDLLRIVRGPICIVVKRHKNSEDCPNRSNAEN